MRLRRADDLLWQAYVAAWPELMKAMTPFVASGRRLSEPLLMDMQAHDYETAKTKLMVIGQQTYGWGSGMVGHLGLPAPEYVDRLRSEYASFQLAQHYAPSPFWGGAYAIYRGLNHTGPAWGFLWTNVIKVDEQKDATDDRCPGADVVAELRASFLLLRREIELAAPDVVVFLTGPNYDDSILAELPGSTMSEVPGHQQNELVYVRHPVLPRLSYRTYHPGFLKRKQKWHLLGEIVRRARESLRLG